MTHKGRTEEWCVSLQQQSLKWYFLDSPLQAVGAGITVVVDEVSDANEEATKGLQPLLSLLPGTCKAVQVDLVVQWQDL